MAKQIFYPYLPEGRKIEYVGGNNLYMFLAKMYAKKYSQDKIMPGAAVVVKDERMIGKGANGSNYHKEHPCQRVALECKSGEKYELCEGCHPKNHSERKAIQNAQDNGHDVNGANLYLWGHWWCCGSCWGKMDREGIDRVFLLKDSEILFNKEHPDNIVGRQFEV